MCRLSVCAMRECVHYWLVAISIVCLCGVLSSCVHAWFLCVVASFCVGTIVSVRVFCVCMLVGVLV